jgi:hypothetical protein
MKTNRLIRTIGPAVAAGAVLITAACGTASAPSTKSASPGSGTAAGSASAKPLTGAQLQNMLVTEVPAGFSLDPKGTANSGEALQVPNTGSVASKSDCGQLSATSFISTTGVSGVSFAQSDYADKANNEISQEIDTFNKGDGVLVMNRMRQVLAQCAKFALKADGVNASMQTKVSPVRGLGNEAVRAVITAPQFYGGLTLVVARVGDNVVSAFYNDTAGSYADGHVVDLVSKIVAKVKAGA